MEFQEHSVTVVVERAAMSYWQRQVLDWIANPSAFKLPERRYADRSKPRPHEWGRADVKAVFRRLRHGRPISRALLVRAERWLFDEIESGYDC